MAVEAYWIQLFESKRDNNGKTCPGEEICAVTGPLRDKTRPIEAICQSCPLRHTKHGSIPTNLAALIITAYRMEALYEKHAGPSYPDHFTPIEWEVFLTLLYARARDQEKDFKAKQSAQEKRAEELRLQQRLARG